MTDIGAAGIVEARSEWTDLLFRNFEQAANIALPGSTSHPRYEDRDKPVGLAVVVAKDLTLAAYLDVFDPSSFKIKPSESGLAFHSNNRSETTEIAWEPTERHAKLLGGEVTSEIGVFSMFALSKLVNLARNRESRTSFNPAKPDIAKGVSGLAGGYRFSSALIGVSGLWEVHDHLITTMFHKELTKRGASSTNVPSPEKLAGEIEKQVGEISKLHEGERSEELDQRRHKITKLLEFITPELKPDTV